MQVNEAYKLGLEKVKIPMGYDGLNFTLLGWRSPSTGTLSGPYLIAIDGNIAIELLRDGVFHSSYPATAEHYEVWIQEKKQKVAN